MIAELVRWIDDSYQRLRFERSKVARRPSGYPILVLIVRFRSGDTTRDITGDSTGDTRLHCDG